MRRCISGVLSPEYPAICRSVSTSILCSGWKPKLLCSDRASPRTATSDDVTSTAQIAICPASNKSRSVNRRMPPTAPPARIVCHGSAFITCRTGTIPNSSPLTNASANATTYVHASGFTGTLIGIFGTGSHALSQRRMPMPPSNPTTPPASETRIASVSSCRRISPRRDPSAMRSAISFERSAARAANKLPRFAHAASRISPASSIIPAMNARAGPPSISPTSPGRASVNFTPSSSLG